MNRRTPTAAAETASAAEVTPSANEGAGSAPIGATEPPPVEELVPTRVVGGGYGHKVDSILRLTPGEAAEAERLGWGDTRPESVAEAERLGELHHANQGFDKRLRLQPQRGRHDPADGSWRSPHEL